MESKDLAWHADREVDRCTIKVTWHAHRATDRCTVTMMWTNKWLTRGILRLENVGNWYKKWLDWKGIESLTSVVIFQQI